MTFEIVHVATGDMQSIRNDVSDEQKLPSSDSQVRDSRGSMPSTTLQPDVISARSGREVWVGRILLLRLEGCQAG
jgi:hypothetical protein